MALMQPPFAYIWMRRSSMPLERRFVYLKRGESHTYGRGESHTYAIGVTLSPFLLQSELF